MNLICKIGVTTAVLLSSIATASAQNIRSYDQRGAYSNSWDDGYGMISPGTEAQRFTGSNGG